MISSDGQRAWVSNQPNQLLMIDLVKREPAGAIAIGDSPEGVGISADGRWIAVAVEETNDVVFVDAATNRRAFVVHVAARTRNTPYSHPTASSSS